MTESWTCYKYRSGDAAIRCLDEGTLYFAKPNELNDTLEAKYDHASPQDFVQVITKTCSDISQDRGDTDLEIDQHRMANMAVIIAKENQNLQLFTNQIGIFSAARRPDHQALWAYYAENSTGVCFELTWSCEIAHRHQIWKTDVLYHRKARVHNRAEDWRTVFYDLARKHPNLCLEELYSLSLDVAARQKYGILTASRAASTKHTDWAHEEEMRLLAPKSVAIPILKDVLKRVHFVSTCGEYWGKIMRLLHAHYPTVELMQWQFNHGEASAIPRPMEFRLVPI